jgi:hypothetical protein
MLFMMGAASHLPLPTSETSNFTLYWVLFLAVWAGIEFNAIKGKTFQAMTTVKQVITSGFILTALFFGIMLISL